MKLPNVITELVKAQNNFDSIAYSNCFTETATVFDEGEKLSRKNGNSKLDSRS